MLYLTPLYDVSDSGRYDCSIEVENDQTHGWSYDPTLSSVSCAQCLVRTAENSLCYLEKSYLLHDVFYAVVVPHLKDVL